MAAELDLKSVWVTDFTPTGFHLTEPTRWAYHYKVPDPEEFKAHMLRYVSLPRRPLPRDAYEALCREHDVEPRADNDLTTYGLTYGDFGMSHYHTDPANRAAGIENTIHQLRCRAIRDEDDLKQREQSQAQPRPAVKPVRTGQLWEPCERCGAEPAYMPLNLCARCWPD